MCHLSSLWLMAKKRLNHNINWFIPIQDLKRILCFHSLQGFFCCFLFELLWLLFIKNFLNWRYKVWLLLSFPKSSRTEISSLEPSLFYYWKMKAKYQDSKATHCSNTSQGGQKRTKNTKLTFFTTCKNNSLKTTLFMCINIMWIVFFYSSQ